MDATLTTGLLGIAGTFATGLLGVCSFVARRIVAAFDKQTANGDKNTEHLGMLVAEVRASREEQRETTRAHGDRLEDLEKTVMDRRLSEATAAMDRVVAAGAITGNFAAVTVERAEPADEPRHVRRALASRPAR